MSRAKKAAAKAADTRIFYTGPTIVGVAVRNTVYAEMPEALAAAAKSRPYLLSLCLPVSGMGEAMRQIQQQKGGIYTLYKKALEEGQAIQEEQQKGATKSCHTSTE